MKKQFDSRILVIARIILFMLGASVGWLAMWQLFLAYPQLVPDGLKITFDAVAALFLGGVLALSAKPIVSLIAYIGSAILKFVTGHKPIELVGVFLGLAVGLMIAFFAHTVMRLFLPIAALRVVLTVLIALIACFFSCIAFVRLLLNPPEAEEETEYQVGYILHSSAFKSAKIAPVVEDWLNGAVYVSAKTVNELIAAVETDSEPLVRYRKLEESDAVRRADSANKLTETEEIARLARLKRLKIVVDSREGDWSFGTGVKVLDIGAL